MIPASYLYKDAFEQHWGRDFARVSGEAAWEPHVDAGQWQQPPLFRAIRAVLSVMFAPTHRERVRPCPGEGDCPPMPA